MALKPHTTLRLTEQQAVDLLSVVDEHLSRDYPEEDSFNNSMRAIRFQLSGARNSHLLPGGLETR